MTKNEVINVIKRDNSIELLNLEKIHKIVESACEGITGVSVSDIEMKAHLSFYDGITTKEINQSLIKSAADLISENSPNYQYVAANLLNYELRKDVWGGKIPPRLYEYICNMINAGYYTPELLEFYTEEEWDKIDSFIDHDRDFKFAHIGLMEYITKYAVRDRTLKNVSPLETPQLTYILIASTLFAQEKSLKAVKSYYNDISLWNISLPTPIMAGVRTNVKQFSSCTLIECSDSLKSINETSSSIVTYASKKAGIGIDASAIRGEGSSVGKEKTRHTGVTPFYRYFESALKSCAQGGVRGASATLYTMLWHSEIEDIIVLKNNKGTADNRVRKLDYAIQINNYLYNRFLKKQNITLFSPNDVPNLRDAFLGDQKEFAKLYETYEKDESIRKKSIPAVELFTKLMIERKETGRIYIFNVDNVNNHSGFTLPIKMSNLCTEIALLTQPMGSVEVYDRIVEKDAILSFIKEMDNNPYVKNYKLIEEQNDILKFSVTEDISEIALCTLSAINLGNIRSLEDLESICRNAVRGLDNLLEYQDYLLPASRRSTENYRPLGIGIVNLAYYLAKNGCTYSDSNGYELIHETMEAIQFYLIKASVELAKERGACKALHNTTYGKGLLPIDHYNKNVDEIVKPKYNLNWEWLRSELIKYGIRNAVLSAQMPAESSAKIMNATNGVDILKALIITKSNKSNVSKQVAPEITRLKNRYDISWEMKSMEGFIKTMAVMQKFIDQSISTSLSYNPSHYENNEIPLSILLKDTLIANKFGLKTLYYLYTNDQRDADLEEKPKSEAQVSEQKDENETCDACTI